MPQMRPLNIHSNTWYSIEFVLAQVYQRSTPTRLPLEDGESQQIHGLAFFQYSPLGAPIHIRVLDILPGNHNSEIRFPLREEELGDGDVYHALSYAWGPPDFTHKFYSAEGFVQVTENLWEALRRYRKAGESIRLWFDAVCIDQSNQQERSQQILLMRMIYSESKCVLIWLGESPSDRVAFEFITRNIDHAIEKDLDSVDAMAHEILPMRTDENQVAVTDLLAKSWLSRVWTYQEINCAAEATISSGSLSIRFGYLHQFCLLFAFVQHEQWLKSKEAQHNLRQIATLSLTRDHLS